MERKQKKLIIVSVVALAGLLAVWALPTAGKVEPNEPPHSAKQMLEEIYDAVVLGASDIAQREGYCESFSGISETQTIFTVPTGKRFVLLKLYCKHGGTQPTDWSLTVNDVLLIDGEINHFEFERETNLTNYHYYYRYMHDFPDRCVTVDAGETLKVEPTLNYILLIGYFYDVQ